MNRLEQPGDSHYDVLGVSPGATDEEIESSFRQLIDGQGYRIGVPLNRQWLRAREIKAAYAALGSPGNRRADDGPPGRTPKPASWTLTANDPATDELVLPETEPNATAPVEKGWPEDTGVSGDGALGPSPADLAPTLNDNEPAPALDDHKRVPARRWVVATAVASGVGLLFLSSWPGRDRQPSTSERTPIVTAPAGQASGTRPVLVDRAPDNFNRAAASDPQLQGGPASALPAVEPQRPGVEGTAQDVGEPGISDAADAQSLADTLSTDIAPTAAASSVPTDAAEAPTMAPAPTPPDTGAPATAIAPPRAKIAPAIIRSPARAKSPGRQVGGPPRWLGGGPTDADNRQGLFQGTVAVQVTVAPGGRVAKCAAVRSSGNAQLDAMTCRLVRERARFTSTFDARGRPVLSQAYLTYVWGRQRGN